MSRTSEQLPHAPDSETLLEKKRVLAVVARNMLVRRNGEWEFFGYLDGLHLERLAEAWEAVHVIAMAVDEKASTFYLGADLYPYTFKSSRITLRVMPGPASPGVVESIKTYVRLLPPLYLYVKGCDAVYAFMPQWLSVLGVLLGVLMRKPVAVYVGGDWREVGRSNVRWSGLRRTAGTVKWVYGTVVDVVQNLVVRRADLVLVHGAALYQRFRRWNNYRRRVCQVSPVLGISSADVYRRSDTCEGAIPTILFVGLLVPNKGVAYLLSAVALLIEKKCRLRGVIVGDGPQRIALEHLRDDLGLTALVEFRGHIANGPALLGVYREADMFVLPTLSEGFPRVLYEAMSQGLPVVASEVGGIGLTLKDGVNVRLVGPANADELARAMGELLTEPKLRRRLISGGYDFVEGVFRSVAVNHPAVLVGKYLLPES